MRKLGRYELVDELGRGGAAIVYLARDTAINRAVAVKVFAPQLARQGDVLTRFQREIKLAVQLEHPHIVPIFDVGMEDDQPYIVLRLLSGGSLADLIQHGPLSMSATLSILQQVASALDAAHRLKIIHRDVKPSNILFDQSGTAYLADFGIAKAIDATTTPLNTWVVGTPAFMSPEQLREQPIDARTDEYALGIVAFTMLTGRLPYEGTTAHTITQQLIEPLPNARLINPQLPGSIQGVLERATAKDPELRYASVGEFVAVLAAAAQGWLDLGGTTPVLEAADLAPARLALPAEASPQSAAPDGAAEPPAAELAVAGRALEATPPVAFARRRSWLLALAGLGVAVVLFSGWQLGAFAGITRMLLVPLNASPTVSPVLASTQSAAISLTTAPLMVTLSPDAIGLAIVTLPPGTAGAALRASPTGATLLTLPDRTIVQVLPGRQRLADDSVWVTARAPNGEAGWVAEALLTYLNQPTAARTPTAGTPTSLTPQPSATGRPPTAASTNALPSATSQPATTLSPTEGPTTAPVATARPGTTSTAPATATHSAPTNTPGSSTAAPPPTNTVLPATNTPGSSTAAPSSTPAPTNTVPPPTNTMPPPTNTPTNTPVPTNTPILPLPTLPLPTLPIPTLPLP